MFPFRGSIKSSGGNSKRTLTLNSKIKQQGVNVEYYKDGINLQFFQKSFLFIKKQNKK